VGEIDGGTELAGKPLCLPLSGAGSPAPRREYPTANTDRTHLWFVGDPESLCPAIARFVRLVGSRPRFLSNRMTSTTCRENKARTEVPEECCENGGLDAFDDDRGDRFMTRPSACSVPPLKLA
jgi:hypothetical protein